MWPFVVMQFISVQLNRIDDHILLRNFNKDVQQWINQPAKDQALLQIP